MEVLGGYDSDSQEGSGYSTEYKPVSQALCSAPIVAVSSSREEAEEESRVIRHDQTELLTNPRANVVLAPQNGPAHPYRFNVSAVGARQAGMGQIEEANMESWTFDEQYQTYQRSGYAVDSETNRILGDYDGYLNANGDTAQTARGSRIMSISAFHYF